MSLGVQHQVWLNQLVAQPSKEYTLKLSKVMLQKRTQCLGVSTWGPWALRCFWKMIGIRDAYLSIQDWTPAQWKLTFHWGGRNLNRGPNDSNAPNRVRISAVGTLKYPGVLRFKSKSHAKTTRIKKQYCLCLCECLCEFICESMCDKGYPGTKN